MTEAFGMKMAFSPANKENRNVGGGILESKAYKSAKSGTFAYINGGEDLTKILKKVELSISCFMR